MPKEVISTAVDRPGLQVSIAMIAVTGLSTLNPGCESMRTSMWARADGH